MEVTQLNVKGVSARVTGFAADLTAKQLVITVTLFQASGQPLGQIAIPIGPNAQPATDALESIPSFDEFIQNDADAQALFAAVQTFTLKIADQYSKTIEVPAS